MRQSIQQLKTQLDAKIARTREIPDDNREEPTTAFSRRLAAETAAEQGGVGFIGEVHGIRQIS